MPTYNVTDPTTGKKVRLTGDSPPTEQELNGIFASIGGGDKPAVAPTTAPETSGGSPFIEGLKHGLKMSGYGALQTVLQGGQGIRELLGMESNQPNVNKVQSMIDESRKSFDPVKKSSPWAAGTGEFVGGTIPTLAMPGGAQKTLIQRLIASAMQGGTIGALQPTSEGESRLINTGTGMGFGAGGQAAFSTVGKSINALRGNVPAKNAVDLLSEKYGIRTTLGESLDNPIMRKSETWLETVPLVGAKGFREKQHQEAEAAAKKFLSNYMIDPAAADSMASNRAFTSNLYEGLKAKIIGIQDQQIPPSETRKAATDLLERYPDIFKRFQDTKREGLIRNIVSDTEDVAKTSPILNAKGQPVTSTTPKTATFDDLWELRDSLGQMIGQAKKKLATGEIDRTNYAQLSKLYSAVNNDIDNWSGSIGRTDIRQSINAANDAYKTYVVKYDIVQRAYDKAMGTVGANEMFSPKTFSTALKNIAYKDKQINKFTASEINEMTGLSNIMQIVKRSGQYMENPPTGNRYGPLAIFGGIEGAAYLAGGATAGLKTAGGAVGVAAVGTFLTTTKTGKALALSASKLEPNSPAMIAIVDEIYKIVPKAAAVATTQPGDIDQILKDIGVNYQ